MAKTPSFGYEIKSKSDLNIMFNELLLPDIIDKVAEKTMKQLTTYVMNAWYNTYSPSDYVRTFEYLKSVTTLKAHISEGGFVEAEVYFDTDKIKPHIRRGGLNAHASFDGTNVSDKIPQWIEFGNNLILKRKSKTEGIRTMEFIRDWLEVNFPKELRKELKRYGLQVSL